MGFLELEFIYDYGASEGSHGANSEWEYPDISSEMIAEAFIDFLKLEINRAYGQHDEYLEYAVNDFGVPLEYVLLVVRIGEAEDPEPLFVDLYNHNRSFQEIFDHVSSTSFFQCVLDFLQSN